MFKKTLAWYLVFAMFIIAIVPRAEGAFSPSEVIVLSEAERTADLEKIQLILETKLVKQRLEDFGYSTDEIKAKLSQLNDHQLHSLAQRLDDIRVGGDGLGIIIVLLVIAILVVLLIKLSGKSVVIK